MPSSLKSSLSITLLSLPSSITEALIPALTASTQVFTFGIMPPCMIFLDINGPESEFVYYSDCVGPDTYEYRGREKTGNPIQVFCPQSLETFKQMVGDYFEVTVGGHTSHRLMNYREQEFILIGSKQG